MAAQSRQCPTRTDGGDPLIAHSISLPTCRRRQRELYHKCYTCVFGPGSPPIVPIASMANGEPPPRRVAEPAPIEITAEGAA